MKEAALRAASTQGGGRLRRPPPCVDSFTDGCVAVAVAVAMAVAEAEAMAVAMAVALVVAVQSQNPGDPRMLDGRLPLGC